MLHQSRDAGTLGQKFPPDRVFLLALQARARTLLKAFVQGCAAVEGDLVLTFVLTRDEAGVRVWVHGSPLDRFLYQVVRVMETGGAEKLSACAAADCPRLFLKVTKKIFCSTRCQSRTYMRRLRAVERAEDARFIQKQKGSRRGKTRTR